MTTLIPLPSSLPGRFTLSRGTGRDYRELARFHYRPRPPATFAMVWCVRHHAVSGEGLDSGRIVAVGVLSYPTPMSRPRHGALGLRGLGWRRGEFMRFANARVRTISRVVVHPQFRALGLGVALVRCLCEHCPTRYVEATALMGRVHPLFERAGMRRYEPEGQGEAIYYLMDREAPASLASTLHGRDAHATRDPVVAWASRPCKPRLALARDLHPQK